MSCSACSARVERCVAALPGVSSVQVNLLTNSMKAAYDSEAQTAEGIIAAVEAAGYGASCAAEAARASTVRDDAPLRRRFVASLCLLAPLALLHHLWHSEASALAQLLLALPVLWLNRRFFISGARSAMHGAPNMDTLVALGAAAAMADGLLNFFLHHRGAYYFESAAMILTLITLGKWLEARATSRTGSALQKLLALLPQTATVLRNGRPTAIPAEAVRAGETVIIRPGDRVPVDGQVIEGASFLDESALTGESLPVEKTAGATVYAGSVNGNGALQARASKTRADSAMSGIIRLVSEAAAAKAPISRLADRVSGVFVPVVVSLACISASAWLALGYPAAFGISCGIAVLVISCPCALGLATPVALMVAIGKGAENGILFRSGEALENAKRIDCIILDKTGTITEGKPRLADTLPAPGRSTEELMQLAVSLEASGNHPLAQAILDAGSGIAPLPATAMAYMPGRGVKAVINGQPCAAGNAALMQELGVSVPDGQAARLANEGKTPLFFAQGGQYIGMLAVADPIKPGSAAAIAALRKLGLRVIMMTGDNARTAAAIARQAGVEEWQAEVLPQDKEALVRRLQQEGRRVAMIGDGINDAPALARADTGIAIGAGADIAIESADIILVRSDLRDAAAAIRLSRAALLNIRENLFWAFFYNLLAIPLAAGAFYPVFGWLLHPAIGAAAMGMSSFCVVANALRLRRFNLEPKPNDMNTITIHIEGMMCPHCEAHVTKALLAIPGVTACKADHKAKCAVLTLNQTVPQETLMAAIRTAGYEPSAL